MSNNNHYNKKSIYNKEIEPLVNQLKIICNLRQMPMFITVAVKNSPKGTEYISDTVLSSSEIKLTDNRIASLLLKINGFEDRCPDYILRDIQELQDYLDRISIEETTGNQIEVELCDDCIPDLIRIIEGGNTAVPPVELTEQKITAEQAEDIGTAQNFTDIKKDLD